MPLTSRQKTTARGTFTLSALCLHNQCNQCIPNIYVQNFALVDCVFTTTQYKIHQQKVTLVGLSRTALLVAVYLSSHLCATFYSSLSLPFNMSPQFRPQSPCAHPPQHLFSSARLQRPRSLLPIATFQHAEPPSPPLYTCSQQAPVPRVSNIASPTPSHPSSQSQQTTSMPHAVTPTASRDVNVPCETVPCVTSELPATVAAPAAVLTAAIPNARDTTTTVPTVSASTVHNAPPPPSSPHGMMSFDTAPPAVSLPLSPSSTIPSGYFPHKRPRASTSTLPSPSPRYHRRFTAVDDIAPSTHADGDNQSLHLVLTDILTSIRCQHEDNKQLRLALRTELSTMTTTVSKPSKK